MTEKELEMTIEEQPFHPNWKALATASFEHKIFIKSTGTENEKVVKSKDLKSPIEIKEEVSEFYQEVLNMPSSSNKSEEKKPQKQNKRHKRKIDKIPFCKQKLFRLALNNDSTGIDALLQNSSNIDINAVDQFGWTALMISACEGSVESFRTLLLNHNADLSIKDRTGNSDRKSVV